MEQRLTPLPLTCTQFPVYIVGKWWRSRRHHLLKILLYFAPLYGVYTKFGTDPVVGYYDPDRPDHITENRPRKPVLGGFLFFFGALILLFFGIMTFTGQVAFS